jgi:hypothetical protein
VSAAAGQRERIRRIAADDPDLAARLVLMMLPAASASLCKPLAYELTVDDVGTRRVGSGEPDFRLTTDAHARGPGHWRCRPARPDAEGAPACPRQAPPGDQAARLSAADVSVGDVVRADGRLDPDVLYAALPHFIDPEWTAGHEFTVRIDRFGAALTVARRVRRRPPRRGQPNQGEAR